MDVRGWVYVISNPAMPGLVKVGFSLKDPALRAQELEGTGSPHPYVVDYEALVANPRSIEQAAHSALKDVHERKEWFRCSARRAVAELQGIVGDNIIVQKSYKSDTEFSALEFNSDTSEDDDELIAWDGHFRAWNRQGYYYEHIRKWSIYENTKLLTESIMSFPPKERRSESDNDLLDFLCRILGRIELLAI